MTAARCEECGAGASGQVPSYILHKPGCPVGKERAQRVAIAVLEEALDKQRKAETEFERCRGITARAIRDAAEVDVPKTELAEITGLARSRIYQILA